MPALVIPIHDLDSFGKDFVFALDEAWLNQAFAESGVRGDATREARVEVHAQRNGTEILVHGRASAWLVTECGRCTKDLPIEVTCDLAALYAPSPEGASPRRDADDEDLDIDPDEPDREFYSGDQVKIDDLVRDYLLLELPMQPSCELGWECPNLDLPDHMRSTSGVQSRGEGGKAFGEDDIDPRLMPLKKLAKRERDDKE